MSEVEKSEIEKNTKWVVDETGEIEGTHVWAFERKCKGSKQPQMLCGLEIVKPKSINSTEVIEKCILCKRRLSALPNDGIGVRQG